MDQLDTEVGATPASIGGSPEKHLAAFTPQQEGQEPWNGLWKSVLKRKPLAAATRDS